MRTPFKSSLPEPSAGRDPRRGCAQGCKYTYPEDGQVGCVEVTGDDLRTLEAAEFVNDTIMDYYTKVLQGRHTRTGDGASSSNLHFFNAFFFKKLTESGAHTASEARCFHVQADTHGRLRRGGVDVVKAFTERGLVRVQIGEDKHKRVRKWTKNVDIFDKAYIFVPIHDHAHWSLAVICHPGGPLAALAAHARCSRAQRGERGRVGGSGQGREWRNAERQASSAASLNKNIEAA